MRAKTIKTTSTEEFQSALQESMDDGFKPTLAIASVSKSMILPFSVAPPTANLSARISKKVLQPFYCLT